MKKIYMLLSVCLIAVMATAQVDIKKLGTNDTVAADGVKEAWWSQVDANDIAEQVEGNVDDAVFTTDPSWKMVYNDTAFIILIEGEDDDLCDEWCTGLSDWQSDRIEVFLDVHTQDLNDGIGASYDNPANFGPWKGHYQFTSPWIKEGTMDTSVTLSAWPKNVPVHYGFHRDGGEFVCEWIIPFTSLLIDEDSVSDVTGADTLFTPVAGKIIGVNFAICDVISDVATDRNFVRYIGTNDPWVNMDNAGTAVIVTDIISNVSSSKFEAAVSLYPNPATSTIYLKNLTGKVNVDIYDIAGRAVISVKDVDGTAGINISGLSSGLYILKADNELIGKFSK